MSKASFQQFLGEPNTEVFIRATDDQKFTRRSQCKCLVPLCICCIVAVIALACLINASIPHHQNGGGGGVTPNATTVDERAIFCYTRGFCSIGVDLTTTYPDSIEGCQLDCRAKACTTFSYLAASNKCKLFKSACKEVTTKNFTFSVTSEAICPPRNICDSKGICEGKLIGSILTDNETKCLSSCADDFSCNWISFDEANRDCSLYSTCEKLSVRNNVISKMPVCGQESNHAQNGYDYVFLKDATHFNLPMRKSKKGVLGARNCAHNCKNAEISECHFFATGKDGTCYVGEFGHPNISEGVEEGFKSIQVRQDIFLPFVSAKGRNLSYDYLIAQSKEANCFIACWEDEKCSDFFHFNSTCYIAKSLKNNYVPDCASTVYYKKYFDRVESILMKHESPGCPGSGFVNLNESTVEIDLPYKNNLSCTWYIHNSKFTTHKAKLTFEDFSVDLHDFVKLYRYHDTTHIPWMTLRDNFDKTEVFLDGPFTTILWKTDFPSLFSNLSSPYKDMVAKLELVEIEAS